MATRPTLRARCSRSSTSPSRTEALGGAVYVEPPASERFVRVYDRLLHDALGSDETVALIRSMLKE